MPGKSDTFEQQLLALIFMGTAIPNLAINATVAPATVFWLSLHYADPGETGAAYNSAVQTSNEVSYPGYGRVSLPRTSGGWSLMPGYRVQLLADLLFPKCTGGTVTATHFGVGMAQTGDGVMLYFGPISPVITITNSVVPILTAPNTYITED